MVAYLFCIEPCLDWVGEVPLKQKTEWSALFYIVSEVSHISSQRATRPKLVIELVGYFDGSNNAYCCLA